MEQDLTDVKISERFCTLCREPVILAYMPGNPEPVDILHAIRVGEHDHDAQTDLSDIEERLYGTPPEGWAD